MSVSVSLHVWGDFACYSRPELKVERVSYRVPTPSAARGVLEAIFWEPQMRYVIDSIRVVRSGNWFSFRRNEVGKVISITEAQSAMLGKKAMQPILAGGGAEDSAQRNMLALCGVEYVFTAEIELTSQAQTGRDNLAKYSDRFRKRASRGKCAHRPSLGCREFIADFDLVETPEAIPIADTHPLTEDFGLMLYDVFDPSLQGLSRNVEPRPVFFKARIDKGMMDCHPSRVTIVRPGTRKV